MRFLARILLFCFAALVSQVQAQAPWTGPAQATVVFYRASSFIGAPYKPSIFDENGELLRMRNGRFVSLPIKPGPHTFTSTMDNNKVTLDAKPGETYYICLTLATYSQYGTFKGQVAQVESGRAKSEVAKLKAADPADLTAGK